jgi:CRISPR-associated exonuclease Cas4
LSDILHSWKSFSANKVNGLLGVRGPLWERESFNHAIRSADHLDYFIEYVARNPVAAGFCAEPADWKWSHCGAGFEPADEYNFVPAGDLPFVEPVSRGELPHLHKEGATYFVTFRLGDAVEYKPRAGKMPAPQGRGGADKMPAPQVRHCGAGFQPASSGQESAGRMPAPQVRHCGTGFQAASSGQESAGRMPAPQFRIVPVEYKRGKPKREHVDLVQLCAQALCLEEMLSVSIAGGAMYYHQTRRRLEVEFDAGLRAETEGLALRMHEIHAGGVTPAPVYGKWCESCSLIEKCMPKTLEKPKSVARYLSSLQKSAMRDDVDH